MYIALSSVQMRAQRSPFDLTSTIAKNWGISNASVQRKMAKSVEFQFTAVLAKNGFDFTYTFFVYDNICEWTSF